MIRKRTVFHFFTLLILALTVFFAWQGGTSLMWGRESGSQKERKAPPPSSPPYLSFTGTEYHFRFWYPARGWDVAPASASVIAQVTNRAGSGFVVLHTSLGFPLSLDEMGREFIDVETDVLKKDFPAAQIHSSDFVSFHKAKAVEIRYEYVSDLGPQGAREIVIIHGKDLFRLRATSLKSSSTGTEPLLSWMMDNFYFYETLASAPAFPTPMPSVPSAGPPSLTASRPPQPTTPAPRSAAPSARPAPTISAPESGEDAQSFYRQARAEYLKFSFPSAGRAVQLFRRASSLDHSFALAYAGQSEALGWRVILLRTHALPAESGETAAALELAEQAAKLSRDHVEVQRALGLAYFLNNNEKDEDKALKRAQQLNPADAQTNLIIAATHLDDLVQLLSDSQAALGLNPSLVGALYLQGYALARLEQHAGALESFNKVIALSPDFAEAYFERGQILADVGQFQEAISSYQKSIALNPKMLSAHFRLAILLQELKRIDEAIQQYQAIIQADPTLAAPYYNLGALFVDEKKDNTQAATYFKKFLELTSDQAKAEQVRTWLLLHPQ